MEQHISEAARRSAANFGPQVVMEVEVLLAGGGDGKQQYMNTATAVAIASLIVATAQFAWQVQHDLRDAGGAPRIEDVERRVIDRLEREGRIAPSPTPQQVETIRATIRETVAQAKPGEGE